MELLADALWRLETCLQAQDARAALPGYLELATQRLADTVAAVLALDDAPGPPGGTAATATQGPPAAAPALDLERVRTLGESMLHALERGSFDESALAALAAALRGCGAQSSLDALQRALDDFDFTAARNALQGLLDQCLDTQRSTP
jgi:hypothetical protein